MKGDENLIKTLNDLLAEELTAISQYMVHSEICDNWGYEKLHKDIERQAIDEMHHAEWLIGRIIFLEGTPIVSSLNPMKIGASVVDMIENDEEAELGAIRAYNAAIQLAGDAGDQAAADLFTTILKEEEAHYDWNKKQRTQIGQIGLENYLSSQVEA